MVYRKEGFKNFGLNTRNLFSTLLQSVLIASPLIIFLALTPQINSYFPLQSVNLTKEVMKQAFPSNILTYSFIGLIWGAGRDLTMLSLLKRYAYISLHFTLGSIVEQQPVPFLPSYPWNLWNWYIFLIWSTYRLYIYLWHARYTIK